MGRLIDEDVLLARISLNYNNHQNISAGAMKDIINTTPTAYDVEKVVAKLEVMEEKRVRFAKQILDYWDKQGTQQTILFLKDIVENSEVQNERIY